MKKYFPLGISLDRKIIQMVDEKRGLISRSRFIGMILCKYLEIEK